MIPSNSIYGAETDRRHQEFISSLAEVAQRHQLYLQEEDKTITQCYQLELSQGNARIEIGRDLPLDLYDAIHACFIRCFS